MADDSQFSTETQPSLQQLADYIVEKLFDVHNLARLETAIANATGKGATNAKAATDAAAVFAAELLGKFLSGIEQYIEPVMGPFLAKLAGHLVGADISTAELRRSAASGGDSVVGQAVSRIAFDMLRAPDGELQPGRDGAQRFVSTMAQLVFNGWFESTAFEMLVTLFPDMDNFESVAELPRDLVNSLGLGRLGRTALRPLAHLLVATPLEWEIHKAHRPTQLGDADVVKAFLRGDYSADEAREELSRAGYSDKRQDVLLKNGYKWLSTDDALTLVRHQVFGRDYAIANLRAQGYDETQANNVLGAAELRRVEAIQDDSVSAIRAAYVDRRISDVELNNFLRSIFVDDDERGAHTTALSTIRDLNKKRPSPAQVEAMVKAKIRPIAAYREALRLDGYEDTDIIGLELLLEYEMNAKADIEKLRAQKETELAKEKADKAAAAAKRQAEIDAQHALARRGSLAELRRAVITGLIPIARYQEVLAADYDADTVQILVAQVTQDRANYVDEQQRAEDARKRAAVKHLSVGELQQAVYDNILTVEQLRAALVDQQLAPADVDVLVRTTQARKADLDAATAKRAAAEQAAKVKSIDLGRFEQLVRRGHRSIGDYQALLKSFGYDDASVAAMVELLNLRIADDQAARDARAALASQHDNRALTLEQIRRAVILGVSTMDDFQRYLVENKFTVDAQRVLVAELRNDVTEADAARRRRAEVGTAGADSRLSLSRAETAARLGVLTPADYQVRLVAAGYTADDIGTEMDLLAIEIADEQDKRARAADAARRATDRGLSLTELAKAVKLGEATLDDYRARAIETGLSVDDAELVTAVLNDEITAKQLSAPGG